MELLDIIKQRYKVNSIEELSESQLWDCANSEDFVDFFSIMVLQSGQWGHYPNRNEVFKYLKQSISANVILRFWYEDGFDNPDPNFKQGFYFEGLNPDGESVIQFN